MSQREEGKLVALKEGGMSFVQIGKLMKRNRKTLERVYKNLQIKEPDEATLKADERLSQLTPLVPVIYEDTMLNSTDPRLRYEAARDLGRGRRLLTDTVNVNDISAKPTNDLIQLLTDVITSIKSNTAIEATEAEYEVVTNNDETANKQALITDSTPTE